MGFHSHVLSISGRGSRVLVSLPSAPSLGNLQGRTPGQLECGRAEHGARCSAGPPPTPRCRAPLACPIYRTSRRESRSAPESRRPASKRARRRSTLCRRRWSRLPLLLVYGVRSLAVRMLCLSHRLFIIVSRSTRSIPSTARWCPGWDQLVLNS